LNEPLLGGARELDEIESFFWILDMNESLQLTNREFEIRYKKDLLGWERTFCTHLKLVKG